MADEERKMSGSKRRSYLGIGVAKLKNSRLGKLMNTVIHIDNSNVNEKSGYNDGKSEKIDSLTESEKQLSERLKHTK